MQNANNHVVIMAGGIGSRFWPMSTTQKPKQFVDILGVGRTLIQMTVDRFETLCPKDNLWVVTGKRYVETVKAQLPEIPEDHILAEPVGRGTAPCIAYACWKISAKYPSANIVFTPADALVLNVPEFRSIIGKALDFTASGDRIVTVGIKPSRPETGYGYIAAGESVDGNTYIYKVDSFREKPDRATAEYYVSQDNYLWNAGIFVWNVDTIVSRLRMYVPDTAKIMDDIAPSFYSPAEEGAVDEFFPRCEKISIDYAVMEKADCIFTIPADFGWSDLGTWGSLKTLIDKDEEGNAVASSAEVRLFDCRDCIVHVPDADSVVVQGLEGYIVAEHGGRLLVCRLDHEQKITDYIK